MPKKITTEIFIEKSQLIHNHKYDYELTNYTYAHSKVIIICSLHGKFLQKACNHLQGRGCHECANRSVTSGKILTKEEFVERAIIVHGDKYDYNDLNYLGNRISGIINCKIHGPFEQLPRAHLNGRGCTKCFLEKKMYSTLEFIEESIKVHGNLYNYSKTIYNNSWTKIIIICKNHGEFLQTTSHHLQGHGCPQCGNIKTSESIKLTLEEFIIKANLRHNNKYDYSLVNYINSNIKIDIICFKHGVFSQIPGGHLAGKGCRFCVATTSKKETIWLDKLGVPQHLRSKSLKINNKRIKPDAYDPETNTIYEFYGDFYHGHPDFFNPDEINPISKKSYRELYNKTIEKERLILNAGYNLITIWEHEFNNILKELLE